MNTIQRAVGWEMTPKKIKEHRRMDDECQQLLKRAITELNLSARAYGGILKVCRAIADLDQTETIQSQQVFEAIRYRSLDGQLWV